MAVSQQIQNLEKSFKVFNRVSSQLETSYHQLEDRVSQLQGELAGRVSAQTVTADASLLRAILTALPAGVVVVDGSGQISEFNPGATAMLGELRHGEMWANVIARVFSPRSDDGHEISLRDGRRVSIATCPLGNQPGQVLLITDLTETRELQDNLGQHQRLIAMGEMAAGLAHQIRTPLASSLLFAAQLKNTRLDNHARSQLADKVTERLRQLESLISDMLIFSRTGYSGQECVSVATLFVELENQIAGLCQQRDIQLVVMCETPTQEIKGNPRILGSALLNLANNAIQAMGKENGQPSRLTLLARNGVCNTVELCVIDNGPGIPEDIQHELFKPFFTTRNDGTGLGLAVVKAVAQAHGGCVRMESIPAQGSEFILQLPIVGTVKNTTPNPEEAL
ncbi:Flagellar sensor histidine kinase FleS [hydrothermal vent metagenome]|uniref:Flagellar sensor histidine kinase FleS n=1 Tax=hydrothermal vent metagenome TaxID=652676 RepID=A0A3B1AY27_9ZZZZ